MAYTVPTVQQFEARFPEFTEVSDVLIGLVIDEAAGTVTTSWLERDYAPAIMLLAAHLLITEGAVERANPNGDGTSSMTTTGSLKSYSVDGVTVTYAGAGGGTGSASGDLSGYSATEYGRRFLALRRANFAGPLVA